ncbi:hypothetical protein VSS37_03215 [Candidatus Thiothrix sp. Deng01]|uniref:Holliday junction resolvase RuvX n=1 Tax=Candidatus Thiothrix phosphatis TaxID=3112415 RepID=A0ABU6CT91_9GAMM|nr:hypothetical protein [Candidatus Thiothrix sp. Deng01]MEB4589979.1 hypothetical protein [Candidatus Thiothrix sp. Deng01]
MTQQLDLVSTSAAYPVAIGLDAGQHTGIAVFDRVNGCFLEIRETTFAGAIWHITETYKRAIIVIELPNTKSVWHKAGKNLAVIQRTAVNVGSVLREAELLRDTLQFVGRRLGCDYEIRTVHPQGKLDADRFRRITGHNGRINQHCRDAGLLVWGV